MLPVLKKLHPVLVLLPLACSSALAEEDPLLAEIDQLLGEGDQEALLQDIDGYPAQERRPTEAASAYFFSELKTGVGHTKNVFFEPASTPASFALVSADVFAVFQSRSLGSFQAFILYDEAFYEDVELRGERYDVPSERSAYIDLKWTYPIARYELSLGTAYSYSEYFFEPAEGDVFISFLLEEKRPIATLALKRSFGKRWMVESVLGYEQPRYAGTSDDFDSKRFELNTYYELSPRHAFRFRLRYTLENYTEARERLPNLITLGNTSLEIDRYQAEVRWDYTWSKEWNGHFLLPVRFEIRNDSGGHYFDSGRVTLLPELEWTWAKIDFQLQGILDFIDYSERLASFETPGDGRTRWQARTEVGLEVSRNLGPFKLWALASWSKSDSNASSIRFETSVVQTGVLVEF